MGKKKIKKNKKSQVEQPPWLNIYASDLDADETVIEIYGDIGESWWEESISARDISRILKPIKSKTIRLKVNSLGGSVFDGTAIHNQLRDHPAKVIAVVDGIAASIASVIVMAADEIQMPANALLMIHDPWTYVAGNANEMRAAADALDVIKESIVASYDRAGLDKEDIREMMSAETWMTAEDALDSGFCDTIINKSENSSPRSSFANYYNNMPQGVRMAKNKTGDKKAPEKGKNNAAKNKKLAKFRAEVARQNEVKAVCDQYGITGDAAQALVHDPEMTGDVLRAEAMAASPHAGAITPPNNQGGAWAHGEYDGQEKFQHAISHGIMLGSGIRPKKKDGKLAKLAPGHEDFLNLTSLELCRAYLAQIGVNTRAMNPRQIANAALGTDEFVETLETTINTVLLSGYMDKPAKHKAITYNMPANNYKDIRALRLESEWDLEKLLEDGKLPSKTIKEGKESYRVQDYGGRYSITHHVFVNDELGAVMQALQRVVRRIPKLEDKDIFKYVVSNPKMGDGTDLFTTTKKTLATAGALSKDTLSAGRALLAQQQDMTKAAAEAEDKTLLIGINDLTTAQELLGAVSQPNDSRVSIWQYLDPVWTAQITSGFYQFADPNEYPVIGFSGLKGDEAPYIETHQKFGTRGFEMAIVHTYGYGVIGKVGVVYTPAT